MNFTDPSLYGMTLPQQREIPMGGIYPFQVPWNFQWNVPPFAQMGMAPPFLQQGLWPQVQHQGLLPQLHQGIAPPFFQKGVTTPVVPGIQQPFLPQTLGYTPPLTAPFLPMGFNPYVQSSFFGLPFANWQRPFSYQY